MHKSLFTKGLAIHSDWNAFLSGEIMDLLAMIEAGIDGNPYTPSPEKVLRFLQVPLAAAKVIILGQDPYPQPGAATGRAFEVGTLHSWNQPFQNISLKNIIRAVYKAYTGEVVVYTKLKDKIYTDFPILPPGKLFGHWEAQGVLLLNTSFTCLPGHPGSHRVIWEKFSDRLLTYIAESAPGATWFIWGNHAAHATRNMQIQKKISSLHPMMCYDVPGRTNDFLYGNQNCFRSFIQEIDWTGYAFSCKNQKQQLLF